MSRDRQARSRLAAALLVLSASSAGCALLRPSEPLHELHGEEPRVHAWMARARGEADARVALRALAQLTLESRSGSGSFRQVILAARPARLRFETLSPLGQTQTLLVTDGERFGFFDGERLERGDVSAEVLRERLGLDFAPGEAVLALLAALPVEPDPADRIFGQGEARVVASPSRRLRFDPAGELELLEALDGDGEVRFRVEYTRWRDASGGRYPFGVTFSFPGTDVRAELDLRDVELNPDLDPALFQAPPQAVE